MALNILHHTPALQVGKPCANSHISEAGFAYRSMDIAELEDAREREAFLPRSFGRQQKYWVIGGTGQFYRPNSGRVVIRVPLECWGAFKAVKFCDAELIAI